MNSAPAQPTPRPWVSGTSRDGLGREAPIITAGPTRIAAMHVPALAPVAEAEVNAQLIVRAVNSFDSLVEALEAAPILSAYHGRGGFDVERYISDYYAWRVTARAALARAQEAQPHGR